MGEFIIEDGVLKAYTGRAEIVEVPKEVHTIGEGAFKACVSLRKVVLPFGLQCIQDHAFKGCRLLEEVRIPNGVSKVGNYAFHRCHALREAVLPPLVEELGDCVFLYCDSLTRVRMPGVKRFGRQVFVNDVLLKEIEISRELDEESICDVFTGCGNIRRICFADGECVEIDNAVEAVTGAHILPSLVRRIAVDVLRMMELQGRCLVRFLTNLKHVDIPEGIEVLAKSCFYDKRGILSVRLPKSLKEIESRAFRNCISLETVEFAGEQVRIHEDAFKNCTSLKTVRTYDGTRYHFSGISGIHQTEAPDMVRVIQKQVLGNFCISGTMLLKYLGEESRVVVPEGITRIAEEAFAGNEAIDRVLLPESVRTIGAEAFRDCLLLQTIRLPEGLEEIGPGAFENCVKLIRIHLPAQVVRIEERTFRRCQVLREVCLPEGFQNIGESAFYGCPSLKKVEFPESLTSIGKMAFFRCSALQEVHLLAGIKQVGSLAFAESGVRSVWVSGNGRDYGTDLFAGCAKLKMLVLEEGVEHIPDKFAYGCAALRQVRLPQSLCSAGRHAWEGTPWLSSCLEGQAGGVFWDGRDLEGEVHLSEQIRILAGGAFYGNEKVTSVVLPESVRWIGPAAFKGCRKLLQVTVPSGLKKLEAEVFSGCTGLWSVTAGKEGVFPVWESVGERAFYRCGKLEQISWENLKEIGKEAFAGCTKLETCCVRSVQSIGERAFAQTRWVEPTEGPFAVVGGIVVFGGGCAGEVCLPKHVTGIAPYAFAGNSRITKIVFSEGLAEIAEGAFSGCSALADAVFPEGLQKIGARAFERCCSIKEVRTASPFVGASAFAGCRSLHTAVLSGVTVLEECTFACCKELRACTCGQAVKIGSGCFAGCGKLRDISFVKAEVIGTHAMEDCDSLTSVELPDGIWIKAHAFEDCCGLEEIRLVGETGQIRLSEYAFSGCTALCRVVCLGETWTFHTYHDMFSEKIPETARLLYHSACSCFETEQETLCGYRGAGRSVRIPEGIRRIEAEVFRDRMMLREVEIPKSVEYIGARAFHGTAWMEQKRKENPLVAVNGMLLDGSSCQMEVTIPKEIRMVCGWAFAGGLGIRSIRFCSDRVRVEEYAFRNCINLEEMILPDGSAVRFTGLSDRTRELPPLARQAAFDSLNCFKTDEDGMLLECTGNISGLRLAYGITSVGDGAFQDGNLLTEVTMPETVRSIGKRAFAGCKWLGAVKGALGVEQIKEQAFAGCGVLRQVELSEKFQHMGARAFENCTSLSEILLPEGMEEIPARAFYRCHKLKKAVFPSTLKRIGKEAFAFCRELTDIRLPDGVLLEERAFEGCKETGGM